MSSHNQTHSYNLLKQSKKKSVRFEERLECQSPLSQTKATTDTESKATTQTESKATTQTESKATIGVEVLGYEMDHTKIDNKSGVGSENKTLPTFCASLSTSRLYRRRKNAENA